MLVLKHINALVNIADQEEVLETVDLMDIDLGIDECNSVQVLVLELPDVDLLAHSGDKEARHSSNGRHWTFLLFVVHRLDLVLG